MESSQITLKTAEKTAFSASNHELARKLLEFDSVFTGYTFETDEAGRLLVWNGTPGFGECKICGSVMPQCGSWTAIHNGKDYVTGLTRRESLGWLFEKLLGGVS